MAREHGLAGIHDAENADQGAHPMQRATVASCTCSETFVGAGYTAALAAWQQHAGIKP